MKIKNKLVDDIAWRRTNRSQLITTRVFIVFLSHSPHIHRSPFVVHIECVTSILLCAANALPRNVDLTYMCTGQLSTDGCLDVAPMTPNWRRQNREKQRG